MATAVLAPRSRQLSRSTLAVTALAWRLRHNRLAMAVAAGPVRRAPVGTVAALLFVNAGLYPWRRGGARGHLEPLVDGWSFTSTAARSVSSVCSCIPGFAGQTAAWAGCSGFSPLDNRNWSVGPVAATPDSEAASPADGRGSLRTHS